MFRKFVKMRGKFIRGYLMNDTHTPAWIIFLIVNIMFRSCLTQSVPAMRLNRLVVKVNSTYKESLFAHLKTYGFTYLYQITPTTFILENDWEYRTLSDSLLIIKDVFTDEVLEAESVRFYKNMTQPWDRGKEMQNQILEYITPIESHDGQVLNVSSVWSRDFSGRGVTIAVTGVGIETNLLDLQKNLKLDLSFNFAYNKSNIKPEYFHNSQSKALLLTDQGNNMAGIIAAEKDNAFCGAGIAYRSNLVGITMFVVSMRNSETSTAPTLTTSSDVIASALTHKLDDISVFVNAWIPSSPFDQLDLATREAINYGATSGRHGLGAVYVVPAGPSGNTLTNNIYTLTVGVLGVNGSKERNTISDASVLTSGMTSSKMVTTSHFNRCIANYKGYSAAVAQIGAIIALGIEANPRLTLREIQHLLVKASEHSWLLTNSIFKRNGAGHYFNEMYGFGALNADKFVTLSENIAVNPLITKTLETAITNPISSIEKNVTFCHSCDIINDVTCLTTVEHVAVTLSTDTPVNDVKIELVSPSGTVSVFIDTENIEQSIIETQLISTNFWDEFAFGTWIVTVQGGNFHINVTTLTLYGTRNWTLPHARSLALKHICEYNGSEKDSGTVNLTTEPSTPKVLDSKNDDDNDDDDKLNIPLVAALPAGIVIMCGMLVFIGMRGGTQGHVSTFGKPKKSKEKQQNAKNQVFTRQISQDNKLHRQVSLLRQQSQSDESNDLTEDIEGEEEAEEAMNGEINQENDLHRQVSLLKKSKLASPSKVLLEDIEGEEAAMKNTKEVV